MSGALQRSLTPAELEQLRGWQRSQHKTRYLRARILLLAETTPNAAVVARAVSVHVQTVRDVLRVFRTQGLAGLEPKSRTGRPVVFDAQAGETLVALLHESPVPDGGDDGRWTLETAANALAMRLGIESVSTETVRTLLRRRRHSWQRAKEWITSPDPKYAFKKNGGSV